MKICLYGINYSPELTGIGKFTGDMALWLAKSGHEVRVVTAPPYYPSWRVFAGYHALLYSVEIVDDIRVFRSPLWVPRRPSGFKRMFHLFSFAVSSLPVMLRQLFWRPDVVWVVEPAIFCAPTALLVGRLSGAKCWLHIQDFEVDAAFDLGFLKGRFLRRAAASLERTLMRGFDRVSSISRQMLERAGSKGVQVQRLRLFPNWVDLSLSVSPNGNSALRRDLGISKDAVVALYSGNMGGKQGLEILADVAAICLDSSDLFFVFCGAGSGRGDLVARCGGLRNVRFLELQPADRLGALLGMADIHLLPQRADAADLVMPSKLTGMLASGRAIVATAHPGTELARVVEGCGVVVPPETPEAFANAVLELAGDAERRSALGRAGRVYAERHLDRDRVLRQFEFELRRLVVGERANSRGKGVLGADRKSGRVSDEEL